MLKAWKVKLHPPLLLPMCHLSVSSNTFGFGIWRDIARLNQRDAWPVYRQTTRTIVSQLGVVEGIRNVPPARRVELLPYAIFGVVPSR